MFRYRAVRFVLLAFALGVAGVRYFHPFDETPVNLPKTRTGDVLVVFPRYHSEMPVTGGSCIGTLTNTRKNACNQ